MYCFHPIKLHNLTKLEGCFLSLITTYNIYKTVFFISHQAFPVIVNYWVTKYVTSMVHMFLCDSSRKWRLQSDSQFISSVAWNLHECWQKCIWSLSEWICKGGFCGNIKFCVWWILKQFLWLVDLYSRCQIHMEKKTKKILNLSREAKCKVMRFAVVQKK